MPCWSLTRQAGEPVRRCVTRTSFTFSPSVLAILSVRSLNSPASFSCSFFSLSSSSLPRSRSPLATDCSCLPSNSLRLVTTHSSTRSYSSSTSTPFLRKISRCGLFFAAAKESAVM